MNNYKILNKNFDVQKLRELDLKDLDILAQEIRDYIINVTQENGGHIGPSLGVVELSIILHYVYNTPEDKLIWDVGHQAYAHKIITGRYEEFKSLRKLMGISGFLKEKESEFDVYEAGHTSTSISAAAGFVLSRKYNKEDHSVISVIGDGALTGGVAFEGLNYLGSLKEDVLVILNDNEMSIASNVGGFSKYFNQIITHKIYIKAKNEIQKILKGLKMSDNFIDFAERIEESLKNIIIKGAFFEDLGFEYFGPVDGHDLKELQYIMKKMKNIKGSKLLHVYTQKGKGFKKAEKNPEAFHGISPAGVKKGVTKYTKVFSDKLLELAEKDDKVVSITAAMPSGTGLKVIREKIPERYIDVGIAEQSALVIANALAKNGFKPFVAIYSTFLQRAFDQLIHDVALQNKPVKLFLDRAGLVGQDGPTHHGTFDISYLKLIPNMVSMAPKDSSEMKMMIDFMYEYNEGPIAMRYPRGEAVKPFIEKKSEDIELGKSEIVEYNEKATIAFIALGRMVYEAFETMNKLEKENISASILNLRFIKPMDKESIVKVTKNADIIVTLEYGNIPGGVGDTINSIILKNLGEKKKIINIGIEDTFIEHGNQDKLFELSGLDSNSIYKKIKKCLK